MSKDNHGQVAGFQGTGLFLYVVIVYHQIVQCRGVRRKLGPGRDQPLR